MDEILKLVYRVIFFVFLYLVISDSQRTCSNFLECYKIYGIPLDGVWRCVKGFCELLIDFNTYKVREVAIVRGENIN
ncbi:putative Late nodulin [Medicago truncatula]|uniref:Nodule Cysteine-Rich (NCR) secreted peptide n=1 Tax=Medicago truncatula TaxID=3880 RepID=A0A072UA67_MEDTR|nr:Nodule Cysteine-Rich (NCR) secreted peptide [Medicago truncatula]RHN51133.1 putative Late nodulin [Medicago truncatula]